MNELEEKIEIDEFDHKRKKILLITTLCYEMIFLSLLGYAIYLLVIHYVYGPLVFSSMLMHVFIWPYLFNRFLSSLLELGHYGFLYKGKVQYLVYEILIVVAIEMLIWALSAIFAPSSAALYYMSLPILCSLIVLFVIERYTMKELMLQIKKSKRQLIYYPDEQ
jgi:hypothetical protein